MIPHDEAHRDAVIETGFWLAVAMLLIAVVIGVLLELFLPAPPPEPVSTHTLSSTCHRASVARDQCDRI
jgi:competence protein ComGC